MKPLTKESLSFAGGFSYWMINRALNVDNDVLLSMMYYCIIVYKNR